MSAKKDGRTSGKNQEKQKNVSIQNNASKQKRISGQKQVSERKYVSGKKRTSGKKQTSRQKNNSGQKQAFRQKLLVAAAAVIGCLCIAYLCVSFYFMKHFFPNTIINGQDFSGQTAEAAEAFFKERTEGYSLTVIANGSGTETIHGSEISLTCREGGEIKAVLKQQNAFQWPVKLWDKKA